MEILTFRQTHTHTIDDYRMRKPLIILNLLLGKTWVLSPKTLMPSEAALIEELWIGGYQLSEAPFMPGAVVGTSHEATH